MKLFSKRVISVALAACLAVGSIAALNAETDSDLADWFAVKADAATIVDSGKCGDNVTYTLDSDGVLTISGTGAMNGNVFASDARVVSVVISYGVTDIGAFTFNDCTNLTSIEIPDSVTSIGDCAFEDCTALTSVTIPDSVVSIGLNAFALCSALTDLTIGGGIKGFGMCAFYGCKSLTNLTIVDGAEIIGECAFYDCAGLTSVTIPDSVTTIGIRAFYNTALYNDVRNWKDDVLYIDNHLIAASIELSGEYTVKSGTKVIAGGAFSGCTGLTSVIIPDGSTSIGGGVFSGCTGLTDISVGGKSVNAKRVVSFDFWGEAITSCNDSDYIGPLLVPEESENGKVRIGIVLQNCVGKDFADLLIDYDPDVLDPATCKVYKSNFGEAMDLIGSYCVCECNPTVPGQAKIGFCFAESVLSEEEFAERAEKTNLDFDFDYNADKAEILVLEIEKKADCNDTETKLRLLGRVDENFYDVTFTIPLENASDDKHIEPTTEPTTEPETTPAIPDSGETTEKAECSHICHKKGITAILYNIARFFWKLFKINKLCDCGVAHY